MDINTVKWFIKEREAIRNGKVTADNVLLNSRFCNIHREDDKVSKWIFTNCLTISQLLIARLINRIDLLELWKSLDYNTQAYLETSKVYTNSGAYQFYPRKGETIKDIFVDIEEAKYHLSDIIEEFAEGNSIADLTRIVATEAKRPLYFYFMMVILDAGYLGYANIDMASEPYMGPGGKPILKQLGMTLEEISQELDLPMYDVEHILCEVRKYINRTNDGIPNNRKRNV